MNTNTDKKKSVTKKTAITTGLDNISKFSKEDKLAIANLPREEARTLVDNYYQIQETRKRLGNQITAVEKESDIKKESDMLTTGWLFNNFYSMEKEIKKSLDIFTSNQPVGVWLKEIKGIGPVLSAGLLAYYDIDKAPKPSCFWQYGGLNIGNRPWYSSTEATGFVKQAKDWVKEQGETGNEDLFLEYLSMISKTNINLLKLREDKNYAKVISMPPHNMRLKTLLYLAGQCFVKVLSKGSLYAKLIRERKIYELEKNERGDYADQAEAALRKKNFGKNTSAYKCYIEGKLPPAHIQQRCENHGVKIFVSHLWEAMYYDKYGKKPDFKVYPLDYEVPQPNGDLVKHVEYIAPEVDYVDIIDSFKNKKL